MLYLVVSGTCIVEMFNVIDFFVLCYRLEADEDAVQEEEKGGHG